MRFRAWIFLSCLLIILAACSPATNNGINTAVTTPTLPGPDVSTVQAPPVEETAEVFLDSWKAEDYAAMYDMLTSVSKDATSLEEFEAKYRSFASEAALSNLDLQILSSLTQTKNAQVSYRVGLTSALIGEVVRDTMMNLTQENGEWRIEWDDTLILPELSGGNTLRMDYLLPSRGNIYDNKDQALVAQADATALGVFPDQIDPDQENRLLSELWRLTGIYPDTIRQMYENFPPGAGWYLPIGEAPADLVQEREGILSGLAGLVMRPFRSRYYFNDGIAPHVVGYTSFIPEDQVEEYKRMGYRQDERVGMAGLEKWGESSLSGTRGGALYVVDPDGLVVTKLGETAAQPAQSIYSTLNKDLQLGAQKAIDGFKGSVVVMEKDTGRVLAMASSPGYDPNLFEPTNFNSGYKLQELFDQNNQPLLNRATQGQYPIGSIFKLVTMAAALDSGLYTKDTMYNCGTTFDELQGVTLYDWTYEKELPASGPLSLSEGLMRSCNPYFYHIGRDLYLNGLTTAISDMALSFGLGEPTRIDQVAEETGQVPVPESELDATNLAIGQGAFLATPLQVADFIAAIGNGGTLYRPQVIEKIAPPDGEPSLVFKPEQRGKLSISPENLKIIQDAMISVIENPRGTAHRVFANFPYDLAGKTGTAQDPPRLPHAWFGGYTFEGREDKPDIAAVVMIENSGEGSEIAAPIFKGIMQLYFTGKRDPFPWETLPGVWKTPTPEETETPQP